MVKHADSQHRGCQFDSSIFHFEHAIGEEGNGKPPQEFHFPREKLRALSLASATLEMEYALQAYSKQVTYINTYLHARICNF